MLRLTVSSVPRGTSEGLATTRCEQTERDQERSAHRFRHHLTVIGHNDCLIRQIAPAGLLGLSFCVRLSVRSTPCSEDNGIKYRPGELARCLAQPSASAEFEAVGHEPTDLHTHSVKPNCPGSDWLITVIVQSDPQWTIWFDRIDCIAARSSICWNAHMHYLIVSIARGKDEQTTF